MCLSPVQVPGYLEAQKALKAAGIDEVLVYCVNDGAVMDAWAKDQGTEGSMVTLLGDTQGVRAEIGACTERTFCALLPPPQETERGEDVLVPAP